MRSTKSRKQFKHNKRKLSKRGKRNSRKLSKRGKRKLSKKSLKGGSFFTKIFAKKPSGGLVNARL